MKIGGFTIDEGAVLAPMAGITNPPFRKLCRQMGAVLTVTELISSFALVYLSKKKSAQKSALGISTLGLLERYKGESPFAVQIFGRISDRMAEAARLAEERGADIIDLNFGCPARKVVKAGEGAGAALLRDPPLLQEIARRVVDSVSAPVTAKIRLGWSPAELNAPEVAKRLEDVGVEAVCVHARTRDQVHSGPVDLKTLAAVCAAVKIPIIGNGGIRSRDDAVAMMERTGCARVAVGQASRGNPWIFGEIRWGKGTATLKERVEVCRRHLTLYAEWAGQERAAKEMRKHACWYIKGFSGAADLRRRLNEAVDVESFERILAEIPLSLSGTRRRGRTPDS